MRWPEAVVEAAGPESQLLPGVGLQLPGGVRLELNDQKQVPLVAAHCCAPLKSHAEFVGEPEGVRGGGSLRHAQRLQTACQLTLLGFHFGIGRKFHT